MMEGLTARFTFRCLALEGLWTDMVTSLVGGPMEALATKVEDGKSQVEEQGQASSNFNKLVIFGLEAVNIPSGWKSEKVLTHLGLKWISSTMPASPDLMNMGLAGGSGGWRVVF